MIYLIHGENTLKRDAQIASIAGEATIERVNGETCTVADLPAIFSGQSLFSDQRVLVINNMSQNASVWPSVADYIKQGSDNTLLFCDERPDKRSAAYKAFVKHATTIEVTWPGGRDAPAVEKWLGEYAKRSDVELRPEIIKDMVARATRIDERTEKPVIDQQQLATVTMQLKGQTEITSATLAAVMPPSSYENVFELFGCVLQGDQTALNSMLAHLKQHEEPHRLVALLASQLVNLTALVLAGENTSSDQVASDMGVHPFAMRSLVGQARGLDRQTITECIDTLAAADVAMKTGQDPWQSLEVALMKMLGRIKTPA